MGAVDQAPARIDGQVVEQPLHRAGAGPGEALRHLLLLLGGVDVDRAGWECGAQGLKLRRVDRAQGMRRYPKYRALEGGDVCPARLQQPGEAVEIGQEARLAGCGRLAAAAAVAATAGPVGTPAADRISGFANRMYAIVRNVATAPRTSAAGVDPRDARSKKRITFLALRVTAVRPAP